MFLEDTRRGASARPRSVLVVEDDLDLCECMAEVLRGAGFLVTTALDGREALRAVVEGACVPDAMITDYDMPYLSGGDLIAELRRMPNYCALPMAVITGTPRPVPGAARVLLKPVPADVLVAVVTALCDAARDAL